METKKVLKLLSGYPVQIGMMFATNSSKLFLLSNYGISFMTVSAFFVISIFFGVFYVVIYDTIKYDSMGFERLKKFGQLTIEELASSSRTTKIVYYLNKKVGRKLTIAIVVLCDPSLAVIFGRPGNHEYTYFSNGWSALTLLFLSSIFANFIWFVLEGYV